MRTIKTIIELFDECQIENVIACLHYKPEQVIFVGFKKTMTVGRQERLNRLFSELCPHMKVEYKIVGRYDYKAIVEKLYAIIDHYEDCWLDLTGGKELVLTAMGEISALRRIPMLQFNVRTGELIRVKDCETLSDPERQFLTNRQTVLLNGGVIVRDEETDPDWNFSDEFCQDVEALWHLCKVNCGLWNRQCNVFDGFEMFSLLEKMVVQVDLKDMHERHRDILLHPQLIENLCSMGFLLDYAHEGDKLQFRYKNDQIRRCLTKAGNVLELYAFLALREIMDETAGLYDDLDIGVFVDWDGVLHERNEKVKDTRNEIDIFAMHGFVPIFISCKNGLVHKEALYELETVAEQFGGPYAKRVLLTTYISNDEESRNYLLKRAEDMSIIVIDGIEKMTREELKEKLRQRVR